VAEAAGSALRVLAAGSSAGREHLELLDRRGRGGVAAGIRQAAAEIADSVRAGGDAALLQAVRRFDGFEALSADALRLAPSPPTDSPAVDPQVAEAIDRARTISRSQGTELRIHNRDGRIADSDSHGNDPFPPKG